MSAKHALLGLLLDRPAYPYQLAGQLEDRLGPAWQVNSGQLYQTVKGLEKDGLIERVEQPSAGESERHVFRVTDAGVGEFERFFEQTPEKVRLCRRPLILKLAFAGPDRLPEALQKLDDYERECAARLKEIAGRREQVSGEGPLLRADHMLLRLSLSADVFQLEGELRWAAHAREMLSWLAGRDAVWPGRERSDPESEMARRRRAGARKQLFGRMAGTDKDDEDGPAGPSARGA